MDDNREERERILMHMTPMTDRMMPIHWLKLLDERTPFYFKFLEKIFIEIPFFTIVDVAFAIGYGWLGWYLYQLAEPYVTKIGQQIWAQILSTFEWLWNSIANFDYSLPINITGVAVALMILMLPLPANVLIFDNFIYVQLEASLDSCN